jgi:regulator of replication initiation timing
LAIENEKLRKDLQVRIDDLEALKGKFKIMDNEYHIVSTENSKLKDEIK